jgi:hypothetical protein
MEENDLFHLIFRRLPKKHASDEGNPAWSDRTCVMLAAHS